MKAKRRHDLQTNTLAKVITNAPTWWGQHGAKTLFVAVVALLVGFLVRYRITSSQESAIRAAQELATARAMINELRTLEPWRGMPPEQLLASRRQVSGEASTAIENAINDAGDRRIKVEGLVARGDLNWLLASFAEIPGASTQPGLASAKSHDSLIDLASESYQSVLDSYASDKDAAIAAHFGLAAIAEDRADWDAAAKHYDAILNDADAAAAYQAHARERKEALSTIKRPALLVPATTRATTVPAVTTAPVVKIPVPSTRIPVAITTTRATTKP